MNDFENPEGLKNGLVAAPAEVEAAILELFDSLNVEGQGRVLERLAHMAATKAGLTAELARDEFYFNPDE